MRSPGLMKNLDPAGRLGMRRDMQGGFELTRGMFMILIGYGIHQRSIHRKMAKV